MKHLIYIGHQYHSVTKSVGFLLNILKKEYEVSMISFDMEKMDFVGNLDLLHKKYDVLVLFQMPIPVSIINDSFRFDYAAYFPMYDGTGNCPKEFWMQYKGFSIINFSKTLHEQLLPYGLKSFYIQYFPDCTNIGEFGDPKSCFIWQRRENITLACVSPILKQLGIKKVHIHNCPDPGITIPSYDSDMGFEITTSTWFDTKQEMLDIIEKSAYYFAPRMLEGIGMSFLEAMSMGRCVIAFDNPTMNEYIKDNVNGLLINGYNDILNENIDVMKLQTQALETIKNGYTSWIRNQNNIITWITAQKYPQKVHSLKSILKGIRNRIFVNDN